MSFASSLSAALRLREFAVQCLESGHTSCANRAASGRCELDSQPRLHWEADTRRRRRAPGRAGNASRAGGVDALTQCVPPNRSTFPPPGIGLSRRSGRGWG